METRTKGWVLIMMLCWVVCSWQGNTSSRGKIGEGKWENYFSSETKYYSWEWKIFLRNNSKSNEFPMRQTSDRGGEGVYIGIWHCGWCVCVNLEEMVKSLGNCRCDYSLFYLNAVPLLQLQFHRILFHSPCLNYSPHLHICLFISLPSRSVLCIICTESKAFSSPPNVATSNSIPNRSAFDKSIWLSRALYRENKIKKNKNFKADYNKSLNWAERAWFFSSCIPICISSPAHMPAMQMKNDENLNLNQRQKLWIALSGGKRGNVLRTLHHTYTLILMPYTHTLRDIILP